MCLNYLVNFLQGIFLIIILYNLFIIIRYYRIFKFSVSVNPLCAAVPHFPFVGNAFLSLFSGAKANFVGIINWGIKYFRFPLNFWYGLNYHYVTINPNELRIILNHPKCIDKSELYNDLQYIFGSSLLLMPGEKWKKRRHYLRTVYKYNMLKTYVPTIQQQSDLLIKKIKSMPENENLFNFFNKYTFTIFFLTAFGLYGDHIDPEVEKFGVLVDKLQDELVKLIVNPAMPVCIWVRSPLGTKLRQLNREMRNMIKQLLINRKKLKAETTEYFENPNDMLLIDLLLGEGFGAENEFDMYSELTLFSAAATDTTGHALAFCFTLLAMHPEIQQRVYDEVISVVGDHKIEPGNIQQLKYTETVICELLRLLPTIPLTTRYCSEDIDIGTKVIPKGANIVIDIFHAHRDPANWPDPLKFDPSRFSPENYSKIIPGSYLPFLLGPRNCIGQGLATISMKITVASVIREFKLTSSHKSVNEFILESCVSMKTKNRLDCHFIARDKSENKQL